MRWLTEKWFRVDFCFFDEVSFYLCQKEYSIFHPQQIRLRYIWDQGASLCRFVPLWLHRGYSSMTVSLVEQCDQEIWVFLAECGYFACHLQLWRILSPHILDAKLWIFKHPILTHFQTSLFKTFWDKKLRQRNVLKGEFWKWRCFSKSFLHSGDTPERA